MPDEIKKIENFLAGAEKIRFNSPGNKSAEKIFSRWEIKEAPRPFIIKTTTFRIAGKIIKTSGVKGKTAVFLWDSENDCPALVVETSRGEEKFLIKFHEGTPEIEKCRASIMKYDGISHGARLEVVFELVTRKQNTEGINSLIGISKKNFFREIQEISSIFNPETIKSLKRLRTGEIRELIKEATADMAQDEMSHQLSLGLDGTFAAGHADDTGKKEKDKTVEIKGRTRWEIIRELESVATVSEIKAEEEKESLLTFESAEVSAPPSGKDLPVKLKTPPGSPFLQGNIIYVKIRGEKELFGTFKIDIFDAETIYGRLRCDFPEKAQKYFNRMVGKLPVSPGGFIASLMNNILSKVKTSPVNTLSPSLIHTLGLKPFFLGIHSGEKNSSVETMDNSQLKAFYSATDPRNPLVLVQGPPGTGKTFVMEKVIRKLCEKGLRILVAAPSNTAVDNICGRLSGLPVLRFGRTSYSIAPDVARKYWIQNNDAVDRFVRKKQEYAGGGVYAGTNVGLLKDSIISGDITQNGIFDVIIFDEAGMCGIQEFLLCTEMAGKTILFGDHQQLPPFPVSPTVYAKLKEKYPVIPEKVKKMLNISALEYLADYRNIPVIMLRHSYRCQNPRLLRFASTHFYDAGIKTSHEAEYFRLPFNERRKRYSASTMRLYSTSGLPTGIRSEQLFFDAGKPGLANHAEAIICAHIFYKVAVKYPLSEISIIAPYRKQVALITETLSLDYLNSIINKQINAKEWKKFLRTGISTVDSFQGQESDVVITCYVRSNANEGLGFIDNPNRMNVAHTRCRREMHITGDLECLKKQSNSEIFTRLERTFKRDGEIIKLEKLPVLPGKQPDVKDNLIFY